MKKMFWNGLAVAAVAVSAVAASAQSYKIETSHSEAVFGITHLGLSTVHGAIHAISGTVVYNPANPGASSVEATADVNTINTGEDARDKHLKGPDFFDTAQFGTLTFKSTKVEREGEGLKVTGNLTLHGVTKEVVLHVEKPRTGTGLDKKAHVGFTATTVIKRSDFGIGGKFPSAALSDEVKISLDIDGAAN